MKDELITKSCNEAWITLFRNRVIHAYGLFDKACGNDPIDKILILQNKKVYAVRGSRYAKSFESLVLHYSILNN